ncbi:MAG: phenylalanine--tRNA ligase subunit beta, partial [Bacteroidaceae bacterium]
DASFRFERGVDPLYQVYVLKRAALLIQELAGGTIASTVKDVSGEPVKPFEVLLNYEKVNQLIGKVIPVETVKSILKSLEMEITSETAEGLQLEIPPYRVDVQRDCDVIEDILRVYGYNNVEIPSTLKSSLTVKTDTDRSYKLQNLISEQLVGAGFSEILNNSLTGSAYYENGTTFPADNLVHLLNPLSNDLNCMRQTLLFGGLESIAHNVNRRSTELRFFEYGNVNFFEAEKRVEDKVLSPYREEFHLGLWVTGKKVASSWAHPDEDSSIYELKAYVENIFARVGLDRKNLSLNQVSSDLYSVALQYTTKGGKLLATLGVISRQQRKVFDIDQEVFYADINWKELLKSVRNYKVQYAELSKYPAVKRDLALLVDATVSFADVEKTAYESERKLLKEVWLFDVYEGKKLESGKKSYAVSFLLQDENRTLDEKQIEKIMGKLIANLQNKLNATLR